MQTFSVLSLLVSAIAVSAAPHYYAGGNGGTPPPPTTVVPMAEKFQACGNNQAYSCCNGSTGGLLNLLSGACSLLDGAGTCSNNDVYCCDTTQTGLVNLGVSCNKIGLLDPLL